MFKLEFLLSHKCNQQCYYCNNFKNGNNIVDLFFVEYILNIYHSYKDELYIELSGGEPGLIKNINELVQYLNNKDYIKRIIILSNGLIRKNHKELLEYNKVNCTEHCCLNIIDKTINYFYDDITFFNNTFNNLNQVLVLDKITTNSLISNYKYYKDLGLFNSKYLWLKLLTQKTSIIDNELKLKYKILYNLLQNKNIFSDYIYLNNNKSKTECSKNSLMQYIDLDTKQIGQCSMNVETCEKCNITEENIIKVLNGEMFSKTDCCNGCVKVGLKDEHSNTYI